MSEAALRGAATAAGTRRGADSFGAGARVLGRTGLTVSPVSFGAARVRDEAPLHRRALADALRGGVNLIDTSAHATGGSSERLVGRMLANLVQHGELRREQVVVVSRLGRSEGTDLASLRSGVPGAEVAELGESRAHCIHPTFLRAQLDQSLARLGLQRLDVVLLHDPELCSTEPDAFDDRMRRAFEALEALVALGRVGAYGVSSNGFAEPVDSPRASSLARMLELATEVAGDGHHFSVARMPLNLFELGALQARVGASSNLDVAAAADIGVLAHRPLEALVERGEDSSLVRLADLPDAGGDLEAAAGVLARARKLEAQWATGLGQQLMVGPGENAVDLFRWAQELGPRLASMSLEQWTRLRRDVIATHLGRTSAALLSALEGETRALFSTWWERYGTTLHEAFEAIEGALRSRRRDLARRITAALDPQLPAPWRSLPLSNKAILGALCAPVSTVAVGMRQPGYVHDVLTLREHPIRLLGASAGPIDFGAVRDAMDAVTV
ncbi:MAG: aldo/keto reductase [Nannocystaceae bacterium]|nr:aldo/keto reductase [Nannocystaceae bacterium]